MELLTDFERQSKIWLKLQAHFEKRLELLRVTNDSSKTHLETEKLRGGISEVKALLALGQPDLATESNDGFN